LFYGAAPFLVWGGGGFSNDHCTIPEPLRQFSTKDGTPSLLIRWLPYYEYFQNARRMSFRRNAINIYDKLNAPQTHFISEYEIRSWFNPDEFQDIHISRYAGVSWRASGTKKPAASGKSSS
jgi:hypothetical protein